MTADLPIYIAPELNSAIVFNPDEMAMYTSPLSDNGEVGSLGMLKVEKPSLELCEYLVNHFNKLADFRTDVYKLRLACVIDNFYEKLGLEEDSPFAFINDKGERVPNFMIDPNREGPFATTRWLSHTFSDGESITAYIKRFTDSVEGFPLFEGFTDSSYGNDELDSMHCDRDDTLIYVRGKRTAWMSTHKDFQDVAFRPFHVVSNSDEGEGPEKDLDTYLETMDYLLELGVIQKREEVKPPSM